MGRVGTQAAPQALGVQRGHRGPAQLHMTLMGGPSSCLLRRGTGRHICSSERLLGTERPRAGTC